MYRVLLIFIAFINLLSSERVSGSYNSQQLKDIFGSQICIAGSIAKLDDFVNHGNILLKQAEENFKNINANTTILERKSIQDKSVLSKLNELAQYNELRYFFKLVKEEGPPHSKLYTVSLIVGEEKYVSEGTSLKKAQQNAAMLALENTKYVQPPIKEETDSASLTPTVLLNNLSMKLGLAVNYAFVDEEKQGMLRSNVILDEKSKSYIQKLNKSIYEDDRNLRQKKDISQRKGPFRVKVEVGKYVFYGVSHTIKSARHDAASNALDFLIKNKDNLESDCLNEVDTQQCIQTKANLKSPISLVYEAGQMRKLEVEFEIVDESGPAHMKKFVTLCRIGELTTTGEGKSKKESKKAAAENMLARIPELPPVSQEREVMNMMKDKTKKKNKKKKKIIKTKLEEISMNVEDLVGSVFGFRKDDNDFGKDTDSPKRPQYLKRSYQDELLELSSFLNIEINYSDFEERNNFFSLLSLQIDPEHLCFGQSYSKTEAREKAADGALDVLFSMGLYDHFDEKHSSNMHMDIKSTIQNMMEDVSEDK